jgi:hypothetical protein
LDADTVADILGQEGGHELMELYAEALLPPGGAEREIRACTVVACEAIAADLGVPPPTDAR